MSPLQLGSILVQAVITCFLRCTIIAVHGLGSNVDWSWTWKDNGKCVNWLQDPDMLPAKVPKSRIIAYNYESKWDADAPKTRLQLCGEELVHSIHSLQKHDPNHPIVLVGHSLGGNVIVNGLLYANSEDTFKYLLKATVGLVFLGTPFRGTEWQPFLESLVKLKSFSGSHNGITRELGFDEPILLDKLHGFCRLLNKLSIPASCFSELYETDYGRRYGVRGAIKGMVVTEASACIPGVERHALQTDHLKINKYCSPTDRSFLTVSTTISEMYANAKDIIRRRQAHALEQKPEAEACLRDLFLTDPRDDRIALKRKKGDRAQGTCEWIIGTEEITAWLGSTQKARSEAQTNNILWLHGHPGTGKSTMAIFLTEELPKAFSETDGKTLAYFFCDSNFDKQRTAISIVRGLLLQLIQQHPQLLDYLMPRYRERGAKLFESFDALWEIFMIVAADQSTGQKYCIIDALDECDQTSQEVLLRQLQETFDGSRDMNIHILITSRPYSEIEEYLGQFPNTDLGTFPNAKQDIDVCIEEKLANLTRRKHYTQKVKDQISELLRNKAEGTFLWVGLACKELENVPSKDALKLLQDMPQGLHSLYQRLLNAALAQSSEPNILKRILSFIVVALRPLTVEELSTSCELHQDETDLETRLQFTREHVASCRLMIKIQDDQILLLHQSVKDFLTRTGSGCFINTLDANADMACRFGLYMHETHKRNSKCESQMSNFSRSSLGVETGGYGGSSQQLPT
ncbi:pfs domain-containing protein [Trichoderma citrinoviride]|uniref:Pfs domain-containing protein n=1 Tax=Trichoderma citrinoviride TaxID=58853 RepID=A0A2T4B1H7_9HYPO|nr:pfs domain-containing protein [Trichoderma citrinoviride]PTB63088.1 pfs domain-containing protein [Trichoderma citrinoviride]